MVESEYPMRVAFSFLEDVKELVNSKVDEEK